MISQNVQNKAAIKNNENQQASAVANAQQAGNDARANLNKFNQSNPAPNFSPGAKPTNAPGPTVGAQPGTPIPTSSPQQAQARQQAAQIQQAAQRKQIMAQAAAKAAQPGAPGGPPPPGTNGVNPAVQPPWMKAFMADPKNSDMVRKNILSGGVMGSQNGDLLSRTS
jgi:hypothetical protein